MSDDLISRQAAITLPVMPKEHREYQTFNLDDAYEQGWNDLQKCIELLPSAQQEDKCGECDAWNQYKNYPRKQWIPCNGRLPEAEKKRYWVCTDTEYQCECRWTNNRFGMGEFDEWGWSIFDIPKHSHVVAWMPLPEPYKEEDDAID